MVNPLTRCLEDYSLPPFATLRVSDIVPAVRAAIAEMTLDVNVIEDDLSDPDADISWATVMDRLEIIDDPVNRLWRIAIHLSRVTDSPELRLAQSEVQAEVLTIQSRRAQSVPVFRAMQRLRASPILDATLNGVALNDTEKARFNDIDVKLKELNAVAAGYDVATPAAGPWMLTLDRSNYSAVVTHCTNRSLRQLMYQAERTVATSPPYDNTPIIQEMLQLRREQAALLGFDSFASVSLENKMAPSASAVQDMLDLLRDKCVPLARAELADLEAFVKDFAPDVAATTLPLQHWDIAFWYCPFTPMLDFCADSLPTLSIGSL
ncbi:hypothetical protein DYB36_005316 [Aphanomyces astaci]|uniref:Uncharacterized protein n=1 Tax=Aphanomyces astaci TaxID=112090 RepID=A0A397B7P4_APHAT|nr:hypothetical protein DYB36_005316 [Aphanomyces astaci]RHY88482.1 hypothetical protein DYB31_002944 [Aphanomyces astaci]